MDMEEIRYLLGGTVFARAKAYTDRIQDLNCEVAGNGVRHLSADVRGGGRSLYQTQVWLRENGSFVSASCDCPYNQNGDGTYCKHIGALLLDDAENQKTANAIDFQMAASANELNPLFLKGELDILAVPANLGSVLYNKTQGGVKMLAVSTLGVLYMVEKGGETVTDIQSLAGKTIYATGKGATPEYALTYLLARNGLELGKDVNVEWKSEPTEIVAQMAAQDSAVAMLPQPFVVVAMGQVEGLRVALDLTEQWNALGGDSQLITAVLLVRSEFLDQHPQAVARFMEEYAASAAFVNDQPAEAAVLVEKYGIVKAAVAEKAIPACNIVCLTGDDMKTAASGYLQVLFDQNPESVGGKLPGDDFYWMGN